MTSLPVHVCCRPAPAYESATTREFYHGRTETLRSCTPETVEFVKSMLSSSVPVSLLFHIFFLYHLIYKKSV